QILSPEIVQLNNGLQVRLLGVKSIEEKHDDAINFLSEMTKGQQVFLKYDAVKHDDHNRLCAYVYLKNKTFINAHLLKNRLATIDDSLEFKYKEKFMNIGHA